MHILGFGKTASGVGQYSAETDTRQVFFACTV